MPRPESYKFCETRECEFIYTDSEQQKWHSRASYICLALEGGKFESRWMAHIVIEVDGIC